MVRAGQLASPAGPADRSLGAPRRRPHTEEGAAARSAPGSLRAHHRRLDALPVRHVAPPHDRVRDRQGRPVGQLRARVVDAGRLEHDRVDGIRRRGDDAGAAALLSRRLGLPSGMSGLPQAEEQATRRSRSRIPRRPSMSAPTGLRVHGQQRPHRPLMQLQSSLASVQRNRVHQFHARQSTPCGAPAGGG